MPPSSSTTRRSAGAECRSANSGRTAPTRWDVHPTVWSVAPATSPSNSGCDPTDRVASLRLYSGCDLVGDVHRGVRGVGAAGVDVDDDVVPCAQRMSTRPSRGFGVLLSGSSAEDAVGI